MPAELARVAKWQGVLRLHRQARAQFAVARVCQGHEGVQPVVASVEVERHEDAPVGARGCIGAGGLENALRGGVRKAERSDHEPGAAEQERAPRHRRRGRGMREPPVVAGAMGIDRGARPHQQTWASGPASSRWRSTRWRSGQ